MIILQKGDVDQLRRLRDKKYKTTCPYCGSVLEFGPEDVEASVVLKDEDYYLVCPLCTCCFNINMKPHLIPTIAEVEEIIE